MEFKGCHVCPCIFLYFLSFCFNVHTFSNNKSSKAALSLGMFWVRLGFLFAGPAFDQFANPKFQHRPLKANAELVKTYTLLGE